MTFRHVSAMLPEAVEALACRPGAIIADCTLGGSGHAMTICQHIMPGGVLIGIDQDRAAIENAQEVLRPFEQGVRLFHGNFIMLPEYLDQLGIPSLDGILLDLGLSQYQLDSSGRGFSFQKDEPLDMRMDVRSATTAQDLVNQLDESQLIAVFRDYGEERWAKRIARAVVATRRREPIRTTRQLSRLICDAVPAVTAVKQKIHPATRVFMALRIAVNQEMDRLAQFLSVAVDLLKIGGRMCVLSFHSLEDRQVKQWFKALAKGCTCPPDLPQCVCNGRPRVRLITKKVMRPSEREVSANPMARSTRLRAVEKIAS